MSLPFIGQLGCLFSCCPAAEPQRWMLVEFWGKYRLNLLFSYQTHLLGHKRSAPIVIKGSREWIEKYIPFPEFTQIFGGYLLLSEPNEPSEVMPGEGLGVWGRRNVSKLRRILCERGANFDVVDGEGPAQQIAIRGESARGVS